MPLGRRSPRPSLSALSRATLVATLTFHAATASCTSFGTSAPDPADDSGVRADVSSSDASIDDSSLDARGTPGDDAGDSGTARCASNSTPGSYATAEQCRTESTSECREAPLPSAGSPCAFTGTRGSCVCTPDTTGRWQRLLTTCRCE